METIVERVWKAYYPSHEASLAAARQTHARGTLRGCGGQRIGA